MGDKAIKCSNIKKSVLSSIIASQMLNFSTLPDKNTTYFLILLFFSHTNIRRTKTRILQNTPRQNAFSSRYLRTQLLNAFLNMVGK